MVEQPAGPNLLQEQPWICSVVEAGDVCVVCVCVQVEELNKEEFLTLLHCLQS